MTTPVNVLSLTFDEVHDAARARTAWTAMYLFHEFRPTHRDHDLQSLDVEALKHDFSGVFPILRRVERGFGL
jgi:hypothetical protein